MKVAILAPHMFMHKDIVHKTIFSPGELVIDLVKEMKKKGLDITFISPNYNIQAVENINGDLGYVEEELKLRGYGIMELLHKHPLLFSTIARQIQSELIAKTFELANSGAFDLVHVYMNEEELAMVFARFCKIPVVFTHHEPFNYLTRYRTIFPKYKKLNWISISFSQRKSLGNNTNWVGNIYHGIDQNKYELNLTPKEDYYAYFGRIIEPKGVHLAIAAAKQAGFKLKIAGKHYGENTKDSYWREKIEPYIDGDQIQFIGFINDKKLKQDFLGNAKALLMPSIWDEPFGLVMLEAMACGTPVIGFDSGAIPEIVDHGKNGFIVNKCFKAFEIRNVLDEEMSVRDFAGKIAHASSLNRDTVRKSFEKNFTLDKMASEHINLYSKLITKLI